MKHALSQQEQQLLLLLLMPPPPPPLLLLLLLLFIFFFKGYLQSCAFTKYISKYESIRMHLPKCQKTKFPHIMHDVSLA